MENLMTCQPHPWHSLYSFSQCWSVQGLDQLIINYLKNTYLANHILTTSSYQWVLWRNWRRWEGHSNASMSLPFFWEYPDLESTSELSSHPQTVLPLLPERQVRKASPVREPFRAFGENVTFCLRIFIKFPNEKGACVRVFLENFPKHSL